MIRTAPGFRHCPISLACIVGALLSIFVDLLDVKWYLGVESLHHQVLKAPHPWLSMYRLWTHQVLLDSSAGLFACLVFFFSFRHVERVMGSQRFGWFLLWVFTASPLLLAALIVVGFDPFAGPAFAGPVAVIYGVVALMCSGGMVPHLELESEREEQGAFRFPDLWAKLLGLSLFHLVPLGLAGFSHAMVGYALGWLWLRRTFWFPVKFISLGPHT